VIFLSWLPLLLCIILQIILIYDYVLYWRLHLDGCCRRTVLLQLLWVVRLLGSWKTTWLPVTAGSCLLLKWMNWMRLPPILCHIHSSSKTSSQDTALLIIPQLYTKVASLPRLTSKLQYHSCTQSIAYHFYLGLLVQYHSCTQAIPCLFSFVSAVPQLYNSNFMFI